MKRLFLIVLTALALILGYHLVRDPGIITRRLPLGGQTRSELRSIRNNILSPLHAHVIDPTPTLNEVVARARSKSAPSESDQAAIRLCRVLKSALTERERLKTRLRQVRTKQYEGIARDQGAEKKKLYEADAMRKWDAYVQRTRPQTERLLDLL